MKKISLMMMALLAAVTMSAETVKSDELTSAAFGFNTLKNGYVDKTYTSTEAKVTYAAQANGGVAYLQIRSKNSNSGIVSTSTGGYVKSVRVLQKDTLTPGIIEIFGSNTALTAPSDLYNESKSTKAGIVSGLDGTYSFTNNYTYVGIRSNSGARYIDKVIITWTDTKPGTDPGTWTPDTISVSEAIDLVDKGDVHTHYIYGVVSEAPFCPAKGVYAVMLSDVKDPTKLLEGYNMRKGKASTDVYTSLDEMEQHYALSDTVLIYADGLSKYQTTYQTNSGYYVKTLGKSSALDANAVFPYAFGAVQMEMVGGKYRYEIVLSKEEDEYENALHYVIRTSNEKGIAGTYDTYLDSSYVDGEGQVTGSLKISFVSEGNPNNNYSIKGDFMVGGLKYRMDTTYALAGYTDPDSEPFKLVDDVPFIPQEGDTLTCAVAAKYALTVLAENETSKINVFVLGYANNVGEISSNQQTCYMDDEASKTKTLQSYYGNLSGKKITAGSQVLIYGKMMHYSKSGSHVAEMKNGIVQVLQGGADITDRGIEYETLPSNAITIAQAKALCDNLVGVDTTEEVTVKGYVVDIYKTWNSTSKQQSFYMGDEYVIGVKTHFEAFNTSLAAGVMVGDKMFVTGRVTKYNDSYNLVQGTGHFTSSLTKLNEMVKSAPQGKVQKVFCNGAIYIIREGVAYDLQGNVMK